MIFFKYPLQFFINNYLYIYFFLFLEYIKSIDKDKVKEMFEKSGMKDKFKEHFKSVDVKGWMKKTGIGDHMKEFFGDDCDMKAVASKNMEKFKGSAKEWAKKMPEFVKGMGGKLKGKMGGLGKAKGAAGGAAAAAGAAAGGGGGGGAAAAGAAAAGGGKGGGAAAAGAAAAAA